jgi:hypothetical protein
MTAFRYALLVLHRDCQAGYGESTHTLSVFPPRAIQKARPPTGPSLRLEFLAVWLMQKRVAGVRRLFRVCEKDALLHDPRLVLSKAPHHTRRQYLLLLIDG